MFCKSKSCESTAPLYFLPCCGNSMCGQCLKPKRGSNTLHRNDCPNCYSKLPPTLSPNVYANNLRNLHRKVNKQSPIDWLADIEHENELLAKRIQRQEKKNELEESMKAVREEKEETKRVSSKNNRDSVIGVLNSEVDNDIIMNDQLSEAEIKLKKYNIIEMIRTESNHFIVNLEKLLEYRAKNVQDQKISWEKVFQLFGMEIDSSDDNDNDNQDQNQDENDKENKKKRMTQEKSQSQKSFTPVSVLNRTKQALIPSGSPSIASQTSRNTVDEYEFVDDFPDFNIIPGSQKRSLTKSAQKTPVAAKRIRKASSKSTQSQSLVDESTVSVDLDIPEENPLYSAVQSSCKKPATEVKTGTRISNRRNKQQPEEKKEEAKIQNSGPETEVKDEEETSDVRPRRGRTSNKKNVEDVRDSMIVKDDNKKATGRQKKNVEKNNDVQSMTQKPSKRTKKSSSTNDEGSSENRPETEAENNNPEVKPPARQVSRERRKSSPLKMKSNNSKENLASLKESTIKEPIILRTDWLPEQEKRLKTLPQKMGFKYVDSWSEQVTHVVANCAEDKTTKRTMKYLQGLIGNVWIVSIDWLIDSSKVGYFVDETGYEVAGIKGLSNKCYPALSRLNKVKLFQGSFFVLARSYSGCKVPDLKTIIETGGGTIVKKADPDHKCFVLTENPIDKNDISLKEFCDQVTILNEKFFKEF